MWNTKVGKQGKIRRKFKRTEHFLERGIGGGAIPAVKNKGRTQAQMKVDVSPPSPGFNSNARWTP